VTVVAHAGTPVKHTVHLFRWEAGEGTAAFLRWTPGQFTFQKNYSTNGRCPTKDSLAPPIPASATHVDGIPRMQGWGWLIKTTNTTIIFAPKRPGTFLVRICRPTATIDWDVRWAKMPRKPTVGQPERSKSIGTPRISNDHPQLTPRRRTRPGFGLGPVHPGQQRGWEARIRAQAGPNGGYRHSRHHDVAARRVLRIARRDSAEIVPGIKRGRRPPVRRPGTPVRNLERAGVCRGWPTLTFTLLHGVDQQHA